ncbi:hypothetical protein PY650_21705 [Rhizobium calliandrae]|uniref:Uncharacterized protein n=1 Tax=Rhizobium calliandrae TaxID=1312182 RepID=A0ABT7KLU6_9HYPH|nr:hypothetical protein [Rhizobium calliandrae]MDL2408214.1 hypothetical protein [Rhizobium calliandrae]
MSSGNDAVDPEPLDSAFSAFRIVADGCGNPNSPVSVTRQICAIDFGFSHLESNIRDLSDRISELWGELAPGIGAELCHSRETVR